MSEGAAPPSAHAAEVHWLLGLPFDLVGMRDTLALIRAAAHTRAPLVLATPNVNFLATAARDESFRDQVLACDLCVVDGMPLVWLGRMLGVRFTERVAGSSIVEALRDPGAEPLRIFFFGGDEGVAQAACSKLADGSGGLVPAGFLAPGFGNLDSMSTADIIERINASGADILSVSLGAAKGHAWIARNRAALRVPVISHLGAVVNFIAGTVRRAPAAWQRAGMEWAWRIVEEPALARRYLADGVFLLRLVLGSAIPLWWSLHAGGGAARRPFEAATGEADGVLRLHGRLDEAGRAMLFETVARMPPGGRCDIHLDDLEGVDTRALGILYELRFRSARGARVRLHCGDGPVRRLLSLHRACCLLDQGELS